jgi:hypothetical protein
MSKVTVYQFTRFMISPLLGTQLPKPIPQACPQPVEADMRLLTRDSGFDPMSEVERRFLLQCRDSTGSRGVEWAWPLGDGVRSGATARPVFDGLTFNFFLGNLKIRHKISNVAPSGRDR